MADLKLPSLNTILIAGRLTRDPEKRSSSAPVKMGLASSRWYKRDGEFEEEVTFVDVIAWGPLGDRCMDKLKKGSPVLIEGRLSYSSWETESGQKRSKIEITADRVQFLEKQGDRAPETPAANLPY